MAWQIHHISHGEKRLLLAAIASAFYGAILSAAAVRTLSWRADVDPTQWGSPESWLVLTGTLVLGGLILFMRKHFGNEGPLGWMRTLIAGIWVLVLAGILIGTLNMPLWGTTFGVIIIAGLLVKSPVMLLVSLGWLGLMHWLCRPWQIERRSVFGFGEAEF